MAKKAKQISIDDQIVDETTGEVSTMTIEDIAQAMVLALQPVKDPQLSRIKNTTNAANYPIRGEINLKPSETIPDQTMTVKELIERYQKGLPLGNTQKVPMYVGEEDPFDGIDPRSLDLSERIEMMRNAQQLIKDTQEALQKQEKENRIKKQQADIEAEINRRMKEKEEERLKLQKKE